MSNTAILIRVQARGGKFLGPDIHYSHVEVKDANTGAVLARGQAGHLKQTSPVPEDDSGVLLTDLSKLTGPSTGVVLTYGTDPSKPPQVWYLGVNPGKTAKFLASFQLEVPTLIKITATRLDGEGKLLPEFTASDTTWVEPGMQLTADPGYVIVMPGLAVTVQSAAFDGVGIMVTAKVTMMCGCPIDDAATAQMPHEIPWPAHQFVVTAEAWHGKALLASAPLKLIKTSLFQGTIALAPGLQPFHSLTVVVRAVQASTANTGSGAYPLG